MKKNNNPLPIRENQSKDIDIEKLYSKIDKYLGDKNKKINIFLTLLGVFAAILGVLVAVFGVIAPIAVIYFTHDTYSQNRASEKEISEVKRASYDELHKIKLEEEEVKNNISKTRILLKDAEQSVQQVEKAKQEVFQIKAKIYSYLSSAETEAEKVKKLVDKSDYNLKTIQYKYDIVQAENCMRSKNFKQAISFFGDALKLYDSDASTFYQIGVAYIFDRNYKDALTFVNKAIALEKNDSVFINTRGLLKFIDGQYEEAIKDFDTAINIKLQKGNNVQSNNFDGNDVFQIKIGGIDCSMLPDIGLDSYYYNKGMALSKLNRFPAAAECYKKALALAPNNSEAYFQLGVAQNNMHLYMENIHSLERASSLNPNNAGVFQQLSIAQASLGQNDKALKNIEKSLSLNPNDFQSYAHKAHINLSLGKYQEAFYDIEKSLQIKENADAYKINAALCARCNDISGALQNIELALQLSPQNAEIYFLRVSLILLADNPDFSVAHKDIRTLESLKSDEIIADYLPIIKKLVARIETENNFRFDDIIALLNSTKYSEHPIGQNIRFVIQKKQEQNHWWSKLWPF